MDKRLQELVDFIKTSFDDDTSKKYWISKLNESDCIKGFLLYTLDLL